MLRVEKKPNISLYTSGACAVAAVKGAVDMLVNERVTDETVLTLPAFVRVRFKLLDAAYSNGIAKCAVAKKWTGVEGLDDGVLIYARATKTKKPRDIVINYKKGIGRYTKKTGPYRKNDAAVTPEVKFLMKNAVLDMWEGKKINYGVLIEISCPKGAEVAKKTVNEAYNIIGGIALIGSWGVSVKEDRQSRLDRMTLDMKRARLGGATKLIFSKTNNSETLMGMGIEIDEDKYVVYKDCLYDVAVEAESTDVGGYLFINNLSNSLPLCAGIADSENLSMQNHILSAHAAKAGITGEDIQDILSSVDSKSAYEVLVRCSKQDEVMQSVADEIKLRLSERFPGTEGEVIIFLKDYGIIAKTKGAMDLLSEINSMELIKVDFGRIAYEDMMKEENEE